MGQYIRDLEEYESDPGDFYDEEPTLSPATLDFAHYDGSKGDKNMDKPAHKGEQHVSKLWARVADEIGIKDVDSENDLRQMFDYVSGFSPKAMQEETPETVAPVEPPTFEPSSDLNDARAEFDNTRLDNPNNRMPRLDERFDLVGSGSDDNSMAAIRGGDDLNDYYQNKFIPSLRAEANLAAKEMGERGRFHIANFAGVIPELGSGKDLFDEYIKKLDD